MTPTSSEGIEAEGDPFEKARQQHRRRIGGALAVGVGVALAGALAFA